MTATVIAQLPPFDTGQYEDDEFCMVSGGARLTVRVFGIAPIVFRFNKVRWHQFTALPNCNADMIGDAYFRLVEYPQSVALAAFIRKDSSSIKAYSRLSHYSIFLDESGCHEVFAESVAQE